MNRARRSSFSSSDIQSRAVDVRACVREDDKSIIGLHFSAQDQQQNYSSERLFVVCPTRFDDAIIVSVLTRRLPRYTRTRAFSESCDSIVKTKATMHSFFPFLHNQFSSLVTIDAYLFDLTDKKDKHTRYHQDL